jgi:hypothetical protein
MPALFWICWSETSSPRRSKKPPSCATKIGRKEALGAA